MTQDETPDQRYAAISARIPFGPGTFLFNREVGRREQKARLDASFAQMLADNPRFQPEHPALLELAGFYARESVL